MGRTHARAKIKKTAVKAVTRNDFSTLQLTITAPTENITRTAINGAAAAMAKVVFVICARYRWGRASDCAQAN